MVQIKIFSWFILGRWSIFFFSLTVSKAYCSVSTYLDSGFSMKTNCIWNSLANAIVTLCIVWMKVYASTFLLSVITFLTFTVVVICWLIFFCLFYFSESSKKFAEAWFWYDQCHVKKCEGHIGGNVDVSNCEIHWHSLNVIAWL